MALQFVLASASPARRQLLVAAGIQPFACPSNFDEDQIQLTDPAALVQALATHKAQSVAPQFKEALVLGCDSVLAFGGEIYGKPETPAAAIARWQQMRGQVGELHTGHTLIDTAQQRQISRSQVTRVFFSSPSDAQIAAYVASGEPLRCAGAFAIDGKGSLFIEKLEGCHTNVIGLSMPMLRQLLDELGYSVADFW
ncbi:MAG: septum formation inhibitor Maf [Leptolyngbya sp. RL_3_1]|nr:septum formation inhibitor Maf [Leptolyngbya sp. RL_3_1]